MKLTDTILDGVVVICIDGDLDHSNVNILGDHLTAHLAAGNHRLVFDLAACSFIDEPGRDALLTLEKTLRGTGMLAVVGPTPDVRRLLHRVGLLEVGGFQLYDTVDGARSALNCRD